MVSYIYSLLSYSLLGLNKPWLTVYWPASANNHMINGGCYQQNYITYVSFSEQRKHEVTEEDESLCLQNLLKGGWIDKSFIQLSGIKYSSVCSLFDRRNLTSQVSLPAWAKHPHTFVFFHFLDVLGEICCFILLLKEKKRSKLTFNNISGETEGGGGGAAGERQTGGSSSVCWEGHAVKYVILHLYSV